MSAKWGATFGIGVLLSAAGCGVSKPVDTPILEPGSIPAMPIPVPGQALLAGHVLDESGRGVAGASVLVAETDALATSDTDGRYTLAVPSDSTITLVTTAPGFAKTYHESVVLAGRATVDGFDVLLLPADQITSMNALGAAGSTATLGLMAIRLHSLSPTCVMDGAHLSVWPSKAATVMYSRPSLDGGLDQPDPTADGIQPGVKIAAWLVGAVPPGNMLMISVEQAGCQLMGQSPSMSGLVFPGLRRVDAQALTEADLFLDQGQ